MKSHPLHCWDCGERIIDGKPGAYTPRPTMRQVKFNLTGGSYCESPFCVTCAERPWTRDRLAAFKQAVDEVAPHFRVYRIEGVDGSRVLTERIAGVV